MWVTPNQLLNDSRADVLNVKNAVLGGELCMEDHLQQQITQLFAKLVGITAVNSIDYLMRFFYNVRS